MERVAGSGSRTVYEFARAYVRLALLVLLVSALAGGSAFVVAGLQTKMYEATARLLYGATVDYANPDVQAYTTPAVLQAQLQSVARTITSPFSRTYTERLVASASPNHAPYTVSADAVIDPTGNSWAEVTARSSDSRVAKAAANAAASSFLASRRAAELRQVEGDLKAKQVQMRAYLSQAAKTSNAYLDLFQAVQDLEARKAYILRGGSSFRIVAPATLPEEPYAPRPAQTAFLAFIVVFVAGVGVVFLLDQRDVRLRDAAAVSRVLTLPLIGDVQRINEEAGDLAGYSFTTAQESLKAARANIDFLLADRELRSLGIGGSEQTDGANLLACDLAVAMALSGRRVALIDGALRSGLVSQHFDLPNDRGVTSVVADEVALSDAVRTVSLCGTEATGSDAKASGEASISVLCSGPESADPGFIVASRRFASLVRQFGQERDVVIVTTPALAEGDEAAAVAAAVDGLVCVVDVATARRRTLEAVQGHLKGLACDILGAVILSGKVRTKASAAGIAQVADEDAERVPTEAGVAGS